MRKNGVKGVTDNWPFLYNVPLLFFWCPLLPPPMSSDSVLIWEPRSYRSPGWSMEPDPCGHLKGAFITCYKKQLSDIYSLCVRQRQMWFWTLRLNGGMVELGEKAHICEPTGGRCNTEFDWMPYLVDQISSAGLVGWNSCNRSVHPYALQASTKGWINNTTSTCMCDYFSNHQCCCHEWNTDSFESGPKHRLLLSCCALSQTADLVKTTAVYREMISGPFFKILKRKKARGGWN
jgi:hypothetical protein